MGRPPAPEPFIELNQASYLAENIAGITPETAKVFVYELYDNEGLTPPQENHFGLLTIEYEKKPAYFKLKAPE